MINDVKIRAVQLAKETGSVKRLLDQVSLKTLCMHGQKLQGRDVWTSVPTHTTYGHESGEGTGIPAPAGHRKKTVRGNIRIQPVPCGHSIPRPNQTTPAGLFCVLPAYRPI